MKTENAPQPPDAILQVDGLDGFHVVMYETLHRHGFRTRDVARKDGRCITWLWQTSDFASAWAAAQAELEKDARISSIVILRYPE